MRHTLNSRQKLFCENLLQGMTLRCAYHSAGYKTGDPWAAAAAFRLRSNPVVAAYLAELRETHTSSLIASRDELLAFHTRVLRAAPADLDDADPLYQISKTIVQKGDTTEIRIRLKSLSKQHSAREIARITGLHRPPPKSDTAKTDQILQDLFADLVGPQPTLPDQEDRDAMAYGDDPAWEPYTAWRPRTSDPSSSQPGTTPDPSLQPHTTSDAWPELTPAPPFPGSHLPTPAPAPAKPPLPAQTHPAPYPEESHHPWEKPRALRPS